MFNRFKLRKKKQRLRKKLDKIRRSAQKQKGRKRKILTSGALVLTLLFGKPPPSSAKSFNQNNNNGVVVETVIANNNLDKEIVLARGEGNTPSTGNRPNPFPVGGTTGRGSNRGVPVVPGPRYTPPGVSPYRVPVKITGQGLGGNGDGGGDDGKNNPEFEKGNPKSSLKQDESKKSNIEDRQVEDKSKKKNELADQCDINDDFKTDSKYEGFPYKLDENGNPTIKAVLNSGSEYFVPFDQALDKYYHEDVYNIDKPPGYDPVHAKQLNYKDRLKYLRETIPRENVIKFQIENVKSLQNTDNMKPVPGFLGKNKEPGKLIINRKTNQVHFVNDQTNIWRTTVIKTPTGLQKLAENGFHLFPNAGND